MNLRGPLARSVRVAGKILTEGVRDTLADNATQWAAAIAYYSFLSMFPLLLAAVSLSAYFVSPDWAVGKAILLLREFVPEGDDAVRRIVHDAVHAAHPYAGAVSLVVLLALGSRAFGALSRALNIAYEGVQTGSLARRIAIEIGMMAAVGLLFVGTLFSHYLLLLLWNAVRLLPGDPGPLFTSIVQLIRLIFLVSGFFLVYRFVPRKRLDWRSILLGAVVATLLLTAARPLFYGYVENLANYNLMYGGIAIAVVLLVWAWVAAFITILGGEIASHFQAIVVEGGSVHRQRETSSKLR